VITHRLSTIKHADLIITIQDGVIAETGTHQSLLSEGKLYADLYKYHHIN
jgi:ABC-type transport system involved in Fe-S cluster assembly fused permease/ATPase subunit